MELWTAIARERRLLADQLEALNERQWLVPSLCGEWTVRDVAAHLVVPHTTSTLRFVGAMAAARGNFNRANATLARREAQRSTAELVSDLRAYAEGRFTPPGFGPEASLTDVLIHGQDIRVPLQLATPGPVEDWTATLELLVTPRARRGFVRGVVPAVRLVANDLEWSHGSGDEVIGPASAIALTLCGRTALTSLLDGPGAPTFIAAMTK